MGAKTWMIAYVDSGTKPVDVFSASPQLDRDASSKLAMELFPDMKLVPDADGSLSYTCPPRKQVFVGCYPGVSIVAASKLGIDYPSKLPATYSSAARGRDIYFHAMHSVVDWFAFAFWSSGRLTRSLSLSPDSKVLEDIGEHLPFEAPYWSGQRKVDSDGDEPYPLPFHPLDLGEVALYHLFGYSLDGSPADDLPDEPRFDADSIVLAGFKGSKPWWKIW
jgi:hypothetical protein